MPAMRQTVCAACGVPIVKVVLNDVLEKYNAVVERNIDGFRQRLSVAAKILSSTYRLHFQFELW